MRIKTQKVITALLIAAASAGGFEALLAIINLNQPVIYLQTAFWIFLYLMLMIVFLFDLHFKKSGSWQRAKQKHTNIPSSVHRHTRIVFTAFWDRFEHLRRWAYIRQWLHFLLLPGFIFWATISLFFTNYSIFLSSSHYWYTQQTLALLSSVALVADYWFLKEVFYRRREVVDSDIFVVLTVIKIYAAGILFAAALAMLRFYCLNPLYYSLEVFGYTFLLVYQALYQHRRINHYTITITLLISLMMGLIGQMVYIYWGYDYYTGAIFMTACYNLFWGIFHYRLDRSLTKQTFIEILAISILVAAMVMTTTNFHARILDGCNYYTQIPYHADTQTV